MTNAVFTTSASSIYDDLIEERYHFPKTYLRQVEEAVGDWIVYYEPRRTSGPHSATGRQAYFAIARVERVITDSDRPDHFYAYMSGYLEFDQPVSFRDESGYRESKLQRDDLQTNKGAFGRAVRLLPRDEFEDIVRRGIDTRRDPWEQTSAVAEDAPEYVIRPIVESLTARKFREVPFVGKFAPPTAIPARSPGYASSTVADAPKSKPRISAPWKPTDRMRYVTA